MKDVASVLTAIGALVWPLILGLAIWKLMPVLKTRLSADDVTFKMLGTEISLEQASANVEKHLADLQKKVAELRTVVEQSHPGLLQSVADDKEGHEQESVLWVDDHPENKVFEIEHLKRLEIPVTLAKSTDEALTALARGRYTMVITDMDRQEDGRTIPQAGLVLIQRMKENNFQTPVFLYCSKKAVEMYREKVVAAGAAGVTYSPVELFERLGLYG